jgi:hypothetical protein
MRRGLDVFRRRYGDGPLHLLSLLACFALAGYVVTRVLYAHSRFRIAIWFGGAVVAHDLVLWPLYALADRTAVAASRRRPSRLPAVPWINYLRVPAVISGVLLVVSFPLVFKLSEGAYHSASGLSESPYLGHWLLITGTLFAASAILYAARVGRVVRVVRSGGTGVPSVVPSGGIGDAGASAQHGGHVPHRAEGPLERPGDLGAAAAPPIGHVDLDDPPAVVGRSDDHLERPTEAAVDEPQIDQGLPASSPHGPEVVDLDPAAALEAPGQDPVADPGVDGPGAAAGDSAAEDEIGPTADDGAGDEGKIGPVQ